MPFNYDEVDPYDPKNSWTAQYGGGPSSTSSSGSTPTSWWGANWQNVLNSALSGISAYGQYASAQSANRKNVQLQREQQAWETTMSNTAVQRRAADIEAAGGNRALAFTNGQEASTPNVAAAHVEPNYGNGAANTAMQSMMMAATLKNLQANTDKTIADTHSTSQETRAKRILADNLERYGHDTAGIEYQSKSLEYAIKEIDYRTKGIQADMSAAQLEQFNKVKDDLAKEIEAQARKGKIDADALEQITKLAGTNGNTLFQLGKAVLLKLLGN